MSNVIPVSETVGLDRAERIQKYPTSHEGWVDLYLRRFNAFLSEPYTVAEVQAMGLFRQLDTTATEEVLATTQRVSRDFQFVVEQGIGCTLRGGLVLDGDKGDVTKGEAVWRRSKLLQRIGGILRTCYPLGDVFVESVRREDGKTVMVDYNPTTVEVEYDDLGLEIERAQIVIPSMANGYIIEREIRTLDRENVTREIITQGGARTKETLPHGLKNRVPLVHLRATPFAEPEHSLTIAPSIESALGMVDSMFSQQHAVGTRFGNPLLAMFGFNIPEDADVFKLGRFLDGIPADGDARFLEPDASVIRFMMDAVKQEREAYRATLPEFLLSEAGGNESGKARQYRAQSLVMKYEEIRGRIFKDIADLTAICVAMDARKAWNDEQDMFSVDAGPILEADTAGTIENLSKLKADGVLSHVDYVRAVQRMGFIPDDADPETYAREVLDERADTAAQFFAQTPNPEDDDDGNDREED